MSVENILEVYKQATKQEVANGYKWYKNARLFCKDTAKKYSVSVDVVISVIAALSPANKWERNLIDTITVLEACKEGKGPDDVKVSTYGANKRKAFDIVQNQRPRLVKMSNKTAAFFDNIRYEKSEAVTVDRHAWRIFIGTKDTSQLPKSMTDKQYAKIADAYREAAKALDMAPYVLQAVTWVAFKRMLKDGNQVSLGLDT